MPARKLFRKRFRSLSRKRDMEFKLCIKTTCHGEYWDGGSKTDYELVNLSGKHIPVHTLPEERYKPARPYPAFGPAEIVLEPGEMVIEGGVFCGKPATITFHILPEDLWALFDHWSQPTPAEVVLDWLEDNGELTAHQGNTVRNRLYKLEESR